MAAGLTLQPQFLTRAAPIVHFAGFKGQAQRLAVEEGKHQYFVRGGILNNCPGQAVGVEFDSVEELVEVGLRQHKRIPKLNYPEFGSSIGSWGKAIALTT